MKQNIEQIRENYMEMCKRYAKSKYRRDREYSEYLHRFFYSDGIVDGTQAEDRKSRLPMSYNLYFT